MNKVVLIGRLTKDPELKYTAGNGTAYTQFSIAVDRRTKKDGSKEADFITVVAWQKTAELIATYLKKGSMTGVSGRIQTRSYDAKDGTKRYITEVVAEEIQFLNSKGSGTSNNENHQQNAAPQQSNSFNEGSFNPDDYTPLDGDDIPF